MADPGSDPTPPDERRRRLADAVERVLRSSGATRAAAAGRLLDTCRAGGPPPLDALEDQRLLAELGERDRRRLAELVAALDRLERGTYGACEACGRPVDPARLDVIPEARRCAACEGIGG